MFVLRVHLRTGLVFDFCFGELELATRALNAVTENRIEPRPVEVMDDAGRQVRFHGGEILAESLIDVEVEAIAVLRMGVLMERVTMAEKQRLGIASPPVMPPPMPQSDDFPTMRRSQQGEGGFLMPQQDEGPTRRVPRFSS